MAISVSWYNLHQSSRAAIFLCDLSITHEHPLSCKPEMVVSPASETSNRSRICVGCTMKFLTTDFSIRSCKMHQNASIACGLSTCETNILLQRDFLDLGSKYTVKSFMRRSTFRWKDLADHGGWKESTKTFNSAGTFWRQTPANHGLQRTLVFPSCILKLPDPGSGVSSTLHKAKLSSTDSILKHPNGPETFYLEQITCHHIFLNQIYNGIQT